MQKIPKEAPPITKWKEHIEKMQGCNYAYDGVEFRFTHFDYYKENETVVLYTNARFHSVQAADMPEFLRHWVPVKIEGLPYFDHIMAEAGVNVPENTKPITSEDRVNSMYVNFMEDMINDMEELNEALKKARLNIKDEKSGIAGQNFINQANAIANNADKAIKAKLAIIQGLNTGMRLMGIDKKNKKKGEKE